MKKVTQKYLKSILSYDPETGIFTWKHRKDRDSHWNGHYAHKEAGSYRGQYRQICFNGKKYYSHRLAWLYMKGEWPKEIDHIDGIKDNNVFSNLRLATKEQNAQNRRRGKNNKSGYKGVFYDTRLRKWKSSISFNKNPIVLGYFDSPEKAYQEYCKAAKKYHGEYARVA